MKEGKMSHHPEILKVTKRIKNDEIGGAADTAKELIFALSKMVSETSFTSREALVEMIDEDVIQMLKVMPSLAPPLNALHRVLGRLEEAYATDIPTDELKNIFVQSCDEFIHWANSAISKVWKYGAEKINNGDVVFTWSMSSSVWGIFKEAKKQGKSFEVIVTESSPTNEGFWTVDEMEKAGIRVSVSVDACMGEIIPQCDSCFVGSDSVSSTGYVLNKVGTYPAALVAKTHGVPFYVAADTLKFDPATLIGLPYIIETLKRDDILKKKYPDHIKVIGHLFDMTPPELITAVITEIGLIHPSAAISVLMQMKLSTRLNELLPLYIKGKLK
jgi:ribose 1,5-bisphosphate isomerase